ncbi:MAG: rhomboid family intramembrane serine protease [Treponema sp.]|nr:rhomboid family intramembrane serine protease [Treponema sp.]
MINIIRRPFKEQNGKVVVVYWLMGINILLFAATQFLGPDIRYTLTIHLSMIPVMVIADGWVWTFITYMFMHGSFSHVFFNMFGLFIFGTHVERHMGSKEFLLYYFVTGILAGIFSFAVYLLTGNYIVALMGASGALFAVQLAFAVFFPQAIINIWGILPLRAPVMVLGFTALELIFSITRSNSGVAHLTHLAGFGFGWLYFLIRAGVNPWRRLTGRQ